MNKLIVTGLMLSSFLDNAGVRGIGQALKRIAAQTDNRDSRDGLGFGSYDKKTGIYITDWLRNNPEKTLSGRYIGKGLALCKKYREQLADIYNSNPTAFEDDFGVNIYIAMRIAEVTNSVKPKVTRVQLAEVDDNGEVVRAFKYDGTEAEALLAGLQKFDRQLKAFRAGQHVSKSELADESRRGAVRRAEFPPELHVMPEFLGLCSVG